MNEKKLVQNFKSYINVSPKNNAEKNGALQELTPKLLNGEVVVGAAHNVVMLTPLSQRHHDRGRFGSLFVTNYKLSFVPLEANTNDEKGDSSIEETSFMIPMVAGKESELSFVPLDFAQEESGQRNFLLGPHDIPLTAVGAIYLTDGATSPVRARRILVPTGEMPKKVKGLQVVCKNMLVLNFSFGQAAVGKGRTVAMALLHHAFPKRHDLLFAFECRDLYYPTLPHDLNMFVTPGDWKRELERCECPHWRITCINGTSDAFMLTAGETLIVPNSVLDYSLMESARHFRSGRVPIWVWGRPEGAALLRSGELLPTDSSATTESVYLEQVRRSHPKLTPPHVIYLCGNSVPGAPSPNSLPPLPALHASYKKLVELCTPTTLQGFWTQDSQYYSYLESSRWLRHVGACLAAADDAATHLARNDTVVVLEGDGVDYCAVVSSLTQLLVDPHFRTITGFQSLVQKEWLALGHPFCDRLGLPRPGNGKDTKEPLVQSQLAPVFLLFLDCVWQLQRQFPADFEFTETYLTTLWDCTHNHVFDTFLFNCPRDRELLRDKNFVRRPVWDWGEQFSDADIALFYNPLFPPPAPAARAPQRATSTPTQRLSRTPTKSPHPPDAKTFQRLQPCTSVAAMELWSQCYERWLTPLDAPAVGIVQYHVFNYAVRKEIRRLEEKLKSLSIMSNRHSNGDTEPTEANPPSVVSRFYPFSHDHSNLNSRALDSMQVSLIDASQLLDSQSLLNAPD